MNRVFLFLNFSLRINIRLENQDTRTVIFQYRFIDHNHLVLLYTGPFLKLLPCVSHRDGD